jgi:CBS domain-containing protein
MRGKRMMIFLGEADQWHHQALHMAILEHLRRAGCSGATVTRGIAGFGPHAHIKTTRLLELSVDLPVIITVIDRDERIERLLPEISRMLVAGVITVEDVEVYFYSGAFAGGLPDLKVADVMSKDPEFVPPETSVAEVIERLVERDYTELPVVDPAGRVIATVGDTDLVKAGLTDMSLSLHKAVGPDLVREHLARLKAGASKVRDVMKAPALTVAPTASLKEAARTMHERGVRRLPVVDADGRLVGVIGRLDIFERIVSGFASRTAPHGVKLPQEHRTVAEIMDPSVPEVAGSTPLLEVVEKLAASDLKRVVVTDEQGHLAGIITDTDVVRRVESGERPTLLTLLRSRWSESAKRQLMRSHGQRASDLMTSPVVTVRDTAPVIEALTLTVKEHVKRLPVLDAQGKLVGVVSRPALLAASLDVATTESVQ